MVRMKTGQDQRAIARSVLGKPKKGHEREHALAEWLFSCPEPEIVRIALVNATNLGFYRILDAHGEKKKEKGRGR